MSRPQHVRIAIAGSGFAGLGMAIRLKQRGIEDFVVFERAAEVGGTWRDNDYPGCACDVPSHLYSFSFAPNPTWSRAFSPQAEIQAYLRSCAERFGITPHLRLEHAVLEAAWNEAEKRWHIQTSRGPFTAEVLISAMGALSEPRLPELPGLGKFQGKVFHSARWDHGFELEGKRVAVVGTGASAIQFVPAIQPKVRKLDLYQRTPPWIVPRRDRAISGFERGVFRSLPAAQRLVRGAIYSVRELMVLGFMHPSLMRPVQRLALRHLARQVPDPALRARLTPNYAIGCKRILISNDYLPALGQPNVEVITDGIGEVRANGVVTRDGTERPADAIIFGTGFQVTDPPAARHIRGRDGRTLAETWNGSPQAYLGTTFAGFPNLFMLLGPNTGLGHTSVVFMIECQISHVLRALRFMDERSVAALEPRAEAQAAFVAELERRLGPTVWNAGGCASWYLDATGRNSTIWPGSTWAFKRRVERFEPGNYLCTPSAAHA